MSDTDPDKQSFGAEEDVAAVPVVATNAASTPREEGGAVPSHAPSSTAPVEGHHVAHHITKYGHIKTSGFVPDANAFDEEDLFMCGKAGIRHKDLRREEIDAAARQIHAKRRYLFRKPRALQYFRGKTLVRGSEERSSHRLELFFDLIFVGIIAVLAEEVIAQPSGASLVRYIEHILSIILPVPRHGLGLSPHMSPDISIRPRHIHARCPCFTPTTADVACHARITFRNAVCSLSIAAASAGRLTSSTSSARASIRVALVLIWQNDALSRRSLSLRNAALSRSRRLMAAAWAC